MINWAKFGIDASKVAGGKTFCPKCHGSRKNKRDRSLSVDLATGVFMCHNHPCDFRGSAMEYKPKKEYVKPTTRLETISKKFIDWFEKRGISNNTIIRLQIAEANEWMPQHEKEVPCICFNYIRNDELTNIKYRGPQKAFKMVAGAELIFYNLDSIKGEKEAHITEGECFAGDVELLTENGWVRFDAYNGEMVAAIDPATKKAHFESPYTFINRDYNGEMVSLHNRRGFKITATVGHDFARFRYEEPKLIKVKHERIRQADLLPISAIIDGPGVNLKDDEIRLFIALSADFSFRKTGDVYGAFKKQRKIDRLRQLFASCGIAVTETIDGRGYTSFFVSRKYALPYWNKMFPHEWLSILSLHQRLMIINELPLWDGNFVPNRFQYEYSSKEKLNADFVQALCHTSGISGSIMRRKNEFGSWYKVSILLNKHYQSYQGIKKEISNYSGKVYCVQVSTGFIMTRHNDRVVITGNCDAATLHECGIYNVVSVPNGASLSSNAKLEYLDNCWQEFEDKEVIYLWTDNDEPGLSLRDELARRFGKERIKLVKYPEGYKDPNEVLMGNKEKNLPPLGKEAILQMKESATDWPLEGIVTMDEMFPVITGWYEQGYPKGARVGVMELDKHLTWVPRQLTVITGIPGHGKDEFTDWILALLATRCGWAWGLCDFEESPAETTTKLMEKITGKSFAVRRDPSYRMTIEDVEHAISIIDQKFFFVNTEEIETDIDSILEKAAELVKKKGIKGFRLNPWNWVEYNRNTQVSETEYISQCLTKIVKFARHYDVHFILIAHTTKMHKDKITGKYEIPTLYSISGSANFFNKTHNGITVYRHYDSDMVEVHWQKVKQSWLGEIGQEVFSYNTFTRQYKSVPGQ
jgi:5S rRNA maturation endonuclease (ribonuclease M5)